MPEFDVHGEWSLHQSNGFKTTFNIQQNGTSLTGSASAAGMAGTGRGRVQGDSFIFTVDWNPAGDEKGPLGEYSGTFNLDGRITGVTVDLNHATSQAFWSSDATFKKG
ncbi:hypothetical protein [Streptomyces sp. NPDC102394]|uniref:hypothetical protein n=1 Tax=Streptomyces sp. NPDC102394 TaxID=3366167 RepID=UPI003821E167